jgi:hypothetical protein
LIWRGAILRQQPIITSDLSWVVVSDRWMWVASIATRSGAKSGPGGKRRDFAQRNHCVHEQCLADTLLFLLQWDCVFGV